MCVENAREMVAPVLMLENKIKIVVSLGVLVVGMFMGNMQVCVHHCGGHSMTFGMNVCESCEHAHSYVGCDQHCVAHYHNYGAHAHDCGDASHDYSERDSSLCWV